MADPKRQPPTREQVEAWIRGAGRKAVSEALYDFSVLVDEVGRIVERLETRREDDKWADPYLESIVGAIHGVALLGFPDTPMPGVYDNLVLSETAFDDIARRVRRRTGLAGLVEVSTDA